MDLSLTDEHRAVRDLAADVLGDGPAPGGPWFDRGRWQALCASGLVGIGLGEDVGGAGLDFLAVHLVLEALGRAGSTLPYWPTVVVGALVVDAFGGQPLRSRLLPAVVGGDLLLTGALADDAPAGPEQPRLRATTSADGVELYGVKTVVPIAPVADALVVSAADGEGRPVVAVVDADASGVEVVPQEVTGGVPHGIVRFDGVRVTEQAVLGAGDRGREVLDRLLLYARAGLASLHAGICDEAVRLSAAYTSEREQFGRPIATFQAVSQRVADAHITAEGVRLTALEAAWRIADGRPASEAVTIAAWWAARGSREVLAAAHHVHGGIGVDLDYPLSHYTFLATQHAFVLGSEEAHLARLGAAIAADA